MKIDEKILEIARLQQNMNEELLLLSKGLELQNKIFR